MNGVIFAHEARAVPIWYEGWCIESRGGIGISVDRRVRAPVEPPGVSHLCRTLTGTR